MAKNPSSRPSPRPSGGRSGSVAAPDRKAKLAELQKSQKARERRTLMLIIGASTALVVLLGGVITYGVLDGRSKTPANAILAVGVSAAAASCDPVTNDVATGNSEHVGPGTNSPTITRVTYKTIPPSSGQHFVQPDISGRGFYTAADTPQVETLVHNLEHGYTVLWYTPSVASNADQLKQIAELGAKLDASSGKFIVALWDETRGAFPAGKNYALVHWSATIDAKTGAVGAQAGHRELCGGLSGAVVSSFVQSHPKTDAPEPNAA